MKTTKSLLLAVTGLAVALFAFTGCKPKNAAGELNLFAWSEYVPEDVIKGFTKETGIKVNYETYASGEEMLAKVLAGGVAYDLVQPPDYIAEAMIQNQLLVPLDKAKLDNLKNILPEFRNMPHDPEDGFTVPYMTGTVGIVVNTEKVTTPIKGFKDLFAPANKGRIVVVDDSRELVVAALYTLGHSINDITPASIEAARPVLKNWMPLIKLYDSDSPKTALLNGDVDLGYVWGGEAAILWNEDKKFTYVLPEEGAHIFVDVLCIPTTSKNTEAAHAFINYILRPEISKLISDAFPYTNPNGEARKLLTPEQLANPASYPKDKRKFDTFRHIGETGSLIDQLVTDLKAGS
ncbi:spermidine/putrescine ABC transporter substrate-binding protein [Opitutaceae bacterium TAV4]|nr:spermidine/putrescine ABC transporter substrate-binding protein [Opitutaceae bacterium TAV4]RRJ98877.1 spermidine/putrescine ABC transporter substrate-binding protein [Opitutaceae bacterium TAV3]